MAPWVGYIRVSIAASRSLIPADARIDALRASRKFSYVSRLDFTVYIAAGTWLHMACDDRVMRTPRAIATTVAIIL